jgi:hypothetical protein
MSQRHAVILLLPILWNFSVGIQLLSALTVSALLRLRPLWVVVNPLSRSFLCRTHVNIESLSLNPYMGKALPMSPEKRV